MHWDWATFGIGVACGVIVSVVGGCWLLVAFAKGMEDR